MSNMTSESEDRMQSTDCINSPSDEASTERNMMGNGTLKKGPWTSAEDAILMEYVSKNGQGNWNAVQKDSGLSRCGKSCRLRWANHLRPDLKKGAFTPEEERRIIELHAKMGNKWARMAIELPGRTDNEIKNFWNTRTKRRQRAGLPIYPPDICLQTLSDNTQPHPYPNRDTELIPNNNFQIPGVEFKNFALNQDFLYSQSLLHLPGPTFLDIPTNTLLPQTLGPTSHNNNNFLFPISQSHPPKRIRRYPIYDGGGGGGGGLNDIFPANLYDDHDRSGSHAYLNGNKTSSSDPISWAMKMELPSLQYISTTQLGSGSCGPPSSPLPSLESVDTLVQSSTLIGQEKSTDRNSGLLEAVLFESQTLKKSKRDNTSSDEWEEAYVDAMSPLGHSSASVFSEYTPHVSDEHHSLEAISVKQESDEKSKSKSNHMKYCRPDLLLENSWFGSMSGSDHCGLIDPIGDDFCNGLSHLVGPGAIDGSPFDDESAKWDEIS